MLRKASIFIFGIVSYVVFFANFLYAIAWTGGFLVPTAVDGEPTMPIVPALLNGKPVAPSAKALVEEAAR